ncbi:MAG: site-specific integrase [Actinomycetota bacterium]
MAAKLERTNTPGIFRRHAKGCDGEGRCECPYVVVWRHRGRQHTDTYRTLAEAREAKGNRDAGDRRPVARVGFADYFAEWIESYAGRTARGFSEATRPEYRRPIEAHALGRWGTWKLAEVEPADVRDAFGELRREGASTSAIKKLRAALSAMFATAVEDGLMRANPVQGVRVPAAPSGSEADDGQAKALTRAELSVLLAAIPADWRLFFEFLAHTGLRISEAIGLTWAHIDLGEHPRVRVREQFYKGQRKQLKSGSGRRDIPLSEGMAARLLTHRRDHYQGEDRPVFASRAGTELLPSNVWRRVLKPTRDSVGLSWVSFHTLRHTCASMLFEAGRNVKQVQEWLGHADPGFTLRTYVHLMDDGIGEADFLDGAVRVNTGSTARTETAANRAVLVAAETGD